MVIPSGTRGGASRRRLQEEEAGADPVHCPDKIVL